MTLVSVPVIQDRLYDFTFAPSLDPNSPLDAAIRWSVTTLAAKCSSVLFCRKASANATAPEVFGYMFREYVRKKQLRKNKSNIKLLEKSGKRSMISNIDWLGFDGRFYRFHCDPISRQTSVSRACLPPRCRSNKAARLTNLRCVAHIGKQTTASDM